MNKFNKGLKKCGSSINNLKPYGEGFQWTEIRNNGNFKRNFRTDKEGKGLYYEKSKGDWKVFRSSEKNIIQFPSKNKSTAYGKIRKKLLKLCFAEKFMD